MRFEELDLSDNILDALWDMRFDECTPIQEKCIPPLLDGHDLLGIAQTGTGKTAAYLLPILSMLDEGNYPDDAINCVILSPTRELAQQIDQAMQGFSYYLGNVSSVPVYGGNDGGRYDQKLKALTMGVDVVIATPGRFISHLQMGNVDLSRASFFILDEADRMLDMGFYDDVMYIRKHMPEKIQTLMFSATLPQKIEQMARQLLKSPVKVKLSVSKPADNIHQMAYVCHETQKSGILKDLYSKSELKRAIIFTGKKQNVHSIVRELRKLGCNCCEIHSNLTQAERDEAMYRFKSGQTDVIVATDIISRGIDIDDISLVLNYDVPNDCEDYVHRIGRTARAQRDGKAITFVCEKDFRYFHNIERFLEYEIEKCPLPEGLGTPPDYNNPEKSTKPKKSRNFRKYKKSKGSPKGSRKSHKPTDK